ncbi:hypothetical protein [Streptomyces sp. NPDC059874]
MTGHTGGFKASPEHWRPAAVAVRLLYSRPFGPRLAAGPWGLQSA